MCDYKSYIQPYIYIYIYIYYKTLREEVDWLNWDSKDK